MKRGPAARARRQARRAVERGPREEAPATALTGELPDAPLEPARR
ncbi:hypothetical protein WMF27_18545 [Sorangium sp. So ce281]